MEWAKKSEQEVYDMSWSAVLTELRFMRDKALADYERHEYEKRKAEERAKLKHNV